MAEPSTYSTTFEIRRGRFLLLRVEHDSARHGPQELCATFFNPDGERAMRMTVDELEAAVRKSIERRSP